MISFFYNNSMNILFDSHDLLCEVDVRNDKKSSFWGDLDVKRSILHINWILPDDRMILKGRFLYKVCSGGHYLQFEPIHKALWSFWIFMYQKYSVFEAAGPWILWSSRGGTKRAPIKLKFCMGVSFRMHQLWLKLHWATQKKLNYEHPTGHP